MGILGGSLEAFSLLPGPGILPAAAGRGVDGFGFVAGGGRAAQRPAAGPGCLPSVPLRGQLA